MFCSRETPPARLEVQTDSHGRGPEEEAATLLARHCLARGHNPIGCNVMVPAGEDVLEVVATRTLPAAEPKASLQMRALELRDDVPLDWRSTTVEAKNGNRVILIPRRGLPA